MAQSNEQKKPSYKLKVMDMSVLAPEARNEAAKEPYPAGHFKKFFDVFRSNITQITITNLLTLIFALPLIAVIAVFAIFGAENITYYLQGMEKNVPYLLSGFGMGLSAGESLASVKVLMVLSYRYLICAIAGCMPILGIGLAGNLYIATKTCWGESFVCKKDKYGNDVPRIVYEFFNNGIKKYWKEPIIIMAITGAMVAAIGNMVLTFIEGLWGGNLNGGHIVCLIFAIIIGLAYMLVFVNWLPQATRYNIGVFDKLRNAALTVVAFPIPSVIMLILMVGPFLLMLAGSIFAIIIGIAVMTIGLTYVVMVMVHFNDYMAEAIMVPLYEASQGGGNKKENRKERRAKANQNQYNNSYKRKK